MSLLVQSANISVWMLLTSKMIILILYCNLRQDLKRTIKVFFLGDFNINLLNYNDHKPINNFLDSLASRNRIPYILKPTR